MVAVEEGQLQNQLHQHLSPTPPPAPQDYNVNFYYGERIDYFKACIDLNLNDRCDEGEISTDTFENPEYNNHSFTLTTSDGNLQNFLEQYKVPIHYIEDKLSKDIEFKKYQTPAQQNAYIKMWLKKSV